MRRASGVLLSATLALMAVRANGSIPAADGTYHGCYLKTLGTLRVIDDSTQTCLGKLETQVTWSQKGPQGPAGHSIIAKAVVSGDPNCIEGGTAFVLDGVVVGYACNGKSGADGFPGPKGDPGATGSIGPQGSQGIPGVQGTAGIAGPAGPQGPQGDAGLVGPTGPQGAAGPGMPTGSVVAYAGSVPPAGWLFCDGSAVSRSTYADLFATIGTAHGAGDGGNTFNLPDYRGRFLRGIDGSAGRDPDKASREAMNPGGNVGDTVGSVQDGQFLKHNHTATDQPITQNMEFAHTAYTEYFAQSVGSGVWVNNANPTGSSGGAETRPLNASVTWIIRY